MVTLQQIAQVNVDHVTIIPSVRLDISVTPSAQPDQAGSSNDMSGSVDSVSSAPIPSFKPSEADEILDDYQATYGLEFNHPIVSQLQGEPTPSLPANYPLRHCLYSSCKLKPWNNAYFRVKEYELEVEDMMLFLLHNDQIFYPLRTGHPYLNWTMASLWSFLRQAV